MRTISDRYWAKCASRKTLRLLPPAAAAIAVALLLGGAVARADTTITADTCDQGDLQAAITGGGTVTFSADCTIYPTTPLDVADGSNVVLDGNGHAVTIDGGGDGTAACTGTRLFTLDGNADLTVDGLTLTHACGGDFGSVVYMPQNGSLTLNDSTVSDNYAFGGNINTFGAVTATNSTFANNLAEENGVVIEVFDGPVTLTNDTFVDNTGLEPPGSRDAAIDTFDATTTLQNDLFYGNINGDGTPANCATTSGSFVDDGHNFSNGGGGPTDCTFSAGSGDVLASNPHVDALADNGGPTQTAALTPLTPYSVIDAGITCGATDQRGTSRPGGHCSIGAYQYDTANQTLTTCDEANLDGAVAIANTVGSSTVKFGCSTSIALTSTLAATGSTSLELDGNGNHVTLSGSGARRILSSITGDLTVDGLTLTDGWAGDFGAAMQSTGGGALTVENSTIQDSFAGFSGILQTSGDATVTNSTFVDNTSGQGGVIVAGGVGNVTFSNDTLVNNTDESEGSTDAAISTTSGSITLKNNIFLGNGLVNATGDVTNCATGSGSVVDDGYNLADADGGCGFINGVDNDIIAASPGLTSLLGHNGTPNTFALYGDSPALDAGSCTDTNGDTVATDERGFPRPVGAGCDIGAFEDPAAPTTTLTLSPASPNGSNGWYVTAPQESLSVDDPNGASTATYEGGGSCTPSNTAVCISYSGPFTIANDADHLFHYFSFDASGGYETTKATHIKIDTHKPSTAVDTGTYAPGTWTANDVDVTLTPSDATSGVASTAYTLDGGSPTTYSAPFSVSGDGAHTLAVATTDNAGNVETGNSTQIDIAGDGEGAIQTSPTHVSASSVGQIQFTFAAPSVGLHDGAVSVDVPSGWSAPSTTATDAGYTTADSGTVSVSGRTITVSGLTMDDGDTLTITYGDQSSGGPGATAPSDVGSADWTTEERSAGDGTLTALSSSPSVGVVSASGSGTMTLPTTNVSASSTGHTLTFTYTAAAGGTYHGEVRLSIPQGWSAPSTTPTDPGYVTASEGTVVAFAGQNLAVNHLDLAGGDTVSIVYGDTSGGGPGASAGSTVGDSTAVLAQEASVSGDSDTILAESPTVNIFAADGSGALGTPTVAVSAGATGRTVAFTYTAALGGTSDGKVHLTVPTGWSAPSTTGTDPGYVTSSAGTVGVAGRVITVSGLTLGSGDTVSIVYGSKAGTGPGATAPTDTGDQSWDATEGSLSTDTPGGLSASPSIHVASADGSGQLDLTSAADVTAGSTQSVVFTYTSGAGGLVDGTVKITVPSGWTPPATNAAPGFVESSDGDVSVSGQTITISGLTIDGGVHVTVVYGAEQFGGSGAVAHLGDGTFGTTESSTDSGTATALGTSPAITVYASDGSGTLTGGTAMVSASSQHHAITFAYTVASGGMKNGVVKLVAPSGWSAPSTTSSDAGYTTATGGTVGVSGSTITVSGITQGAGTHVQIVYGSRALGGPGATAPASTGLQPWQASEASLGSDAAADLQHSPQIGVVAADGSGTLTTTPAAVSAKSTGRTLTFKYTAATGGISGGKVSLTVPSGWSAPSTTGSDPGYTTASPGTLAVAGRKITVSGLTRTAGQQLTIVYGSRAATGPGAAAPLMPSNQTWTAAEASLSADTMAALAPSPAVAVAAPDGSGTASTPTRSVAISAQHQTLTFSYKAATGGLVGGSVNLAVPAGWSAPSTTATDPGFSTASTGTAVTSGRTITVSGVTLSAGQQLTIVYGARTGSGPGATAPGAGGAQTWSLHEASATSVPSAALSSLPSIALVAPDGSGGVAPSPVALPFGTTGQSLSFAYTAATGGMISGTLAIAVPSGWTAPSPTATNAGYATSSSGVLSVSGRTITVTGLNLPAHQTVTIVYGSRASGGPGVTIPNTNGPQAWTVQEASGASGTPTTLASLPQFGGVAPDGSGTATSSITSVAHGATRKTITFHYTCASGGMFDGTVTLTVPTGWSAPSTTVGTAGYTTATTGSVAVSGRTVTVSGVTCTSGQATSIVYGSTSGGGHGATAPPTAAGNQPWTMQQRSRAAGTLTALASSPTIKIT